MNQNVPYELQQAFGVGLSGAQAPAIGICYITLTANTDGMVAEANGQLYGPIPWPERKTGFPSAGDPVLLVFTDAGEAWCVGWWPYGGDSVG